MSFKFIPFPNPSSVKKKLMLYCFRTVKDKILVIFRQCSLVKHKSTMLCLS